jgi:hypothetical protein
LRRLVNFARRVQRRPLPILPARERHRSAEHGRRCVAGVGAPRIDDGFGATRKPRSSGPRSGVRGYAAAATAAAATCTRATATARSRTTARSGTTARARITGAGTAARSATTASTGTAARTRAAARTGTTTRSSVTAGTRIAARHRSTAGTVHALANTRGIANRARLQGSKDDPEPKSVSLRRARHSILRFLRRPPSTAHAAGLHAACYQPAILATDWLDQPPGWTSSRASGLRQGQKPQAKPGSSPRVAPGTFAPSGAGRGSCAAGLGLCQRRRSDVHRVPRRILGGMRRIRTMNVAPRGGHERRGQYNGLRSQCTGRAAVVSVTGSSNRT